MGRHCSESRVASRAYAQLATPLRANSINVSSPERWLSVVTGAAIAANGLTHRSLPRLLLAGIGGTLLWRGATGHCPLYGALGISTVGEPDEDRGTEVKVMLRYDPPGGLVAAAVAKIFGEDPVHQVQEELPAFKQLIETG